MSAKISETLSRQLKELEGEASQTQLPVIVTIKQDSDLAALTRKGLKIEHAYENISAVAGTLAASAVQDIAHLDSVKRIDYDGEVHALPKKADQ